MITFRYHVVTLVAVFMAIGVGVLFGATFIDQNIVDGLRASQARPGQKVMAPGDREWNFEAERRKSGVPIDPQTAVFLGLGGGDL